MCESTEFANAQTVLFPQVYLQIPIFRYREITSPMPFDHS